MDIDSPDDDLPVIDRVFRACLERYQKDGFIPQAPALALHILNTDGVELAPSAIRRAWRQLLREGRLSQSAPRAAYVPVVRSRSSARRKPAAPVEAPRPKVHKRPLAGAWRVDCLDTGLEQVIPPGDLRTPTHRGALEAAIAWARANGERVEECTWAIWPAGKESQTLKLWTNQRGEILS